MEDEWEDSDLGSERGDDSGDDSGDIDEDEDVGPAPDSDGSEIEPMPDSDGRAVKSTCIDSESPCIDATVHGPFLCILRYF